ncbi:MAG: sigma-54 dependent transcriptional regulator [Betaproteobacteria bacterium]|jgi:DNA-binding NtrC family response regulator|nr:sigma-54 dependent transcriptional regulator [Betaproteobacteria bacterium]
MANILVVDDEVGIRELLSEILTDEGHTVRLAQSATAAREVRARERPDLVLLDIWMPDIDGISLLKEWATNGALTMPVVMMSGHATIDTAVEATRIGAMDFLEKPIALQKLLGAVKRALRSGEMRQEPRLTLASLGRAPAVMEARKRLAQLANASAPLLLRGESGAMPELYARELQRANTPWVGAGKALSEAPQEILAQAAGGIIFIDELANLSKSQQRNLTFLLARAERSQIRYVSFSSEDPRRLIEERGFDADLLARLSELVLGLPALRDFAQEIPELASTLLVQLVETRFCPPRVFSTAALNALRQYEWPRNLEELQQAVKSAGLAALEEEISAADIERVLMRPASRPAGIGVPLDLPLREARDVFERAYFEHHLARDPSISRLAERSGLERTHLYRKLKALGIPLGRKEE